MWLIALDKSSSLCCRFCVLCVFLLHYEQFVVLSVYFLSSVVCSVVCSINAADCLPWLISEILCNELSSRPTQSFADLSVSQALNVFTIPGLPLTHASDEFEVRSLNVAMCQVPWTQSSPRDWSFTVAAARLCNNLPVCHSDSQLTFLHVSVTTYLSVIVILNLPSCTSL